MGIGHEPSFTSRSYWSILLKELKGGTRCKACEKKFHILRKVAFARTVKEKCPRCGETNKIYIK